MRLNCKGLVCLECFFVSFPEPIAFGVSSVSRLQTVIQDTVITTSGSATYSTFYSTTASVDSTVASAGHTGGYSSKFADQGDFFSRICGTTISAGQDAGGAYYCSPGIGQEDCVPYAYQNDGGEYAKSTGGSIFGTSGTAEIFSYPVAGYDLTTDSQSSCCQHTTSGREGNLKIGKTYPFESEFHKTNFRTSKLNTNGCSPESYCFAETFIHKFCHPHAVYENKLSPGGSDYGTPIAATSMSNELFQSTRKLLWQGQDSDMTFYTFDAVNANLTTIITTNTSTTYFYLSPFVPGLLEPKSMTSSSELFDPDQTVFSKYDTAQDFFGKSTYNLTGSIKTGGFGDTGKSFYIYQFSNENNTWNVIKETTWFFPTSRKTRGDPVWEVTVGGNPITCLQGAGGFDSFINVYFNGGYRIESFMYSAWGSYDCAWGPEIVASGTWMESGSGITEILGDPIEHTGISRGGTYLGNGFTVQEKREIEHPIVLHHVSSTFSGFPSENVFTTIGGDHRPYQNLGVTRIYPPPNNLLYDDFVLQSSIVVNMPEYSSGVFTTSCYPSAYNVSYSVSNKISTWETTSGTPAVVITSSIISQLYLARWDSSFKSGNKTLTYKSTSRSVSCDWITHKSISYARRLTYNFPQYKTPYPNYYFSSGDCVTFGPCKLTVISYESGTGSNQGKSTSATKSSTNSFSTSFGKYGGHIFVSDLFFMWAYPDVSFNETATAFRADAGQTGTVENMETRRLSSGNDFNTGVASWKKMGCL